MSNKKRCTGCKKLKPIEKFWVKRASKDGRDTKCIQCKGAIGKKWYKKNRKIVIAKRTEYGKKNRHKTKIWGNRSRHRGKLLALIQYGGVCECCGECIPDFLAIDHIKGGGNKHRREIKTHTAGANFRRWLKRNNWPKGFRVLCHNCNFSAFKHNGICIHQLINKIWSKGEKKNA